MMRTRFILFLLAASCTGCFSQERQATRWTVGGRMADSDAPQARPPADPFTSQSASGWIRYFPNLSHIAQDGASQLSQAGTAVRSRLQERWEGRMTTSSHVGDHSTHRPQAHPVERDDDYDQASIDEADDRRFVVRGRGTLPMLPVAVVAEVAPQSEPDARLASASIEVGRYDEKDAGEIHPRRSDVSVSPRDRNTRLAGSESVPPQTRRVRSAIRPGRNATAPRVEPSESLEDVESRAPMELQALQRPPVAPAAVPDPFESLQRPAPLRVESPQGVDLNETPALADARAAEEAAPLAEESAAVESPKSTDSGLVIEAPESVVAQRAEGIEAKSAEPATESSQVATKEAEHGPAPSAEGIDELSAEPAPESSLVAPNETERGPESPFAALSLSESSPERTGEWIGAVAERPVPKAALEMPPALNVTSRAASAAAPSGTLRSFRRVPEPLRNAVLSDLSGRPRSEVVRPSSEGTSAELPPAEFPATYYGPDGVGPPRAPAGDRAATSDARRWSLPKFGLVDRWKALRDRKEHPR